MSTTESEREQQIAARAQQLFAERVAGLDGATRSRLAQARARAVDAAATRRFNPWLEPARLLPLGGVAAAALAALLIWQVPQTPAPSVEPVVLNDLDLLLEGENLDLFEDLEFYAWLLEQPELAAGEEAGDGSG
jgi:hypothetical protein